MTDHPEKKIHGIVPTHGAGDAFIECIESLVQQTVRLEQIIIIDNNVKDGSIQRLLGKHGATGPAPVVNGVPLKIIPLASNTGVRWTQRRHRGVAGGL